MTDNKTCPHCGKVLKRLDTAFCKYCGAPLKSEEGEELVIVHGGALAKLIVQLPGEETQEEFLSKPITTIGRRRNNMIQILSPTVSGEHAQVELTAQGHTITDLKSTNGTYLNGKQLDPHKAYSLKSNDIVRFSDELGNSVHMTYIAPSDFTDIEVDITQPFRLVDDISYIGRNPEAAICLDHPAISWNHAKVIQRSETRYTIQDLSSNNGTFLNGKQLRRQEQVLQRGDVIQTGPFNLVYQGKGIFVPYSGERNFRLEATNLGKTIYPTTFLGIKDKKNPIKILQNLDLAVHPREFVAVVGGSGTGKSTLLKALGGVSPATSGTVLVNGDALYNNFDLYRNMMGYVPQDDIIHQNLRVRKALYYTARLRLPDASPQEIEHRVDEVLTKVSLTTQANTLVRNLSGGQRKRVSIAAELLAEPWIFFLDEPTSGLDPGLEKLMMDTLRQLADEGRTIILVTHATENITNNCDQVLFLARGGRLVYFGPPDQATEFFNVKDFSDIYTRISQIFRLKHDPKVSAEIKGEYQEYTTHISSQNEGHTLPAGTLWANRYQKSTLYKTYIANRQTGEIARPRTTSTGTARIELLKHLKQFQVLTHRYLNLIVHDKISLIVLLAVMPLIGLFLLLISDGAALVGHSAEEIARILKTGHRYTIADDAQTLLFMMALAVNLLGVFAAAYEIIKEEIIYRRERIVNLMIAPYFASKFVILSLFTLFQCLLLLMVLSLKIEFPAAGIFIWSPVEYYLTLIFTALASISLGLFISSLVTSRDTVIYMILITLFVQIVFSGAIFELSSITRPLSYLTITRWSLEALGSSTDMEALNQMGQVRVEREIDFGHGKQTLTEDVPTPVNFYVDYDHRALGLLVRWGVLWVHMIVWSGLAIWLIKRKDEI